MLAKPLLAASLLLLGLLAVAPQPAAAIQCQPSDGSVLGQARYETCAYAIDMVYYTPTVKDKTERTGDYACAMVGC